MDGTIYSTATIKDIQKLSKAIVLGTTGGYHEHLSATQLNWLQATSAGRDNIVEEIVAGTAPPLHILLDLTKT